MDGLPDYPVTKVLPELIQGLKTNNTIILIAPPGAGKTTLVPIELLDKVPGKIHLDTSFVKFVKYKRVNFRKKRIVEKLAC